MSATICVASQLDLFTPPTTQISQLKNTYVPHYPLTSLTDDGPLEFDVNASNMYTDLSDTRLYIKAKLTNGQGQPLAEDVKVAPVNMLFHALFNKVDVYIGNRLITQSSGTYPWKAALETILNFGKEAKDTQLASIMFYKDKNVGEAERGIDKRHHLTTLGKKFELFGPLHIDLFFQEKYLISQMPIRIVLHRSSPVFYLHATDVVNPNFKITILEAVLFIRRISVAPEIELAHAKVLERKNAIYSLHKSELEVVPLPRGLLTMNKDNFFAGKVPKKLVVALLSTGAYNGSYTESPFHFRNFNLSTVDLTLDGEPIGGTPLTCNFSQNLYMRAYDNMFNSLNKSYTNYGLDISYKEFKEQALFCFDLTADGCGNSTSHFEINREGNLRIKLKFAESTTDTIYVLLYGEFEGRLEITKAREVLQE